LIRAALTWAAALHLLAACGNPVPDLPNQPATANAAPPKPSVEQVVQAGEATKPPFRVQDGSEGLLLVWYDAEGGAHPASARAEIPEERRGQVRVDSLTVPPERRLDAASIYVADLRAPGADGNYPVRVVNREAFEGAFASSAPAPEQAPAASGEVIIYGASWCGVCKQAAGYLRAKQVPFVEKDIEREPGARSEMQAKARAQGVSTSGIPVIDVYGKLMGGFDRGQLDALLARK
jgi:glutaredoxin